MAPRASKYTSEDVALLPCEMGATSRFFFPIEFDVSGRDRFPQDQADALSRRLLDTTRPLTHVYIFVHGWNKTAYIAEQEYQDFICRLHARITRSEDPTRAPTPESIVMIGVFWHSTVAANFRDPLLIKWLTYFLIRKRADRVAFGGFQQLIRNVAGQVFDRGGIRQLNLIGHSFGGRIIVLGLQQFIRARPRHADGSVFATLMASRISQTNIVTLNAAVAPREVEHTITAGGTTQTTLMETLKNMWHGHFVNVFSRRDLATGGLFPLASVVTTDAVSRAIGARQLGDYPVLDVSESGHVAAPVPSSGTVFNVDASKIVFDHSDIYKGRVATMLNELLGSLDTTPV
jgi:hypothetical protein